MAAGSVKETGSEVLDVVMQRFGKLEIPSEEADRLSNGALVERLIAGGLSPLSATRIVEVERGDAEVGRARTHSQARRS